ncbi:hypothetical protein [Georgenia sp. AZ-5]|uniref:hypothetical protein n=1 Tax=Georgenia sp. AZ-5 TaxID=3367526 RepID=UPI003753FD76
MESSGATARRRDLVTGALLYRGLLQPEGVNATERGVARDVLSGGRARQAPRTDQERSLKDAELVGAGPDEDELIHGDSGQDDGAIG